MDFLELSKSRYSVLHYQNKPVPDELLNKIVEAGISAPTACNFQPQKIKLINSDADKEKLNRIVPSKYYVPAAFLVCYDKSKCWTRKFDGKTSGEIDAAIVTTHMMMEASSLGLGSIWVMYWNPDTMKTEFEIPDQYEPVALLIVGYADKSIEPHKEHFLRKSIEEVLFKFFHKGIEQEWVRRCPMSVIKGLEWTFDTVASTYEKFRPGYVADLYRAIFDYIPIDQASKFVEVGIGGGQATLPILQTGCELTAVEYGAHFSELCREKFQDYPTFSVITSKFEDAALPNDTYDLVFSASAFHWVPEEIGYPKVFSMLKNGGVFARFANHPFRDKGNPALSEEMDRIYKEYYYTYHKRKHETPQEYTEEQARHRALIAEKYGFTDIQYALFQRTRTFTAKEYGILLGTYSDHIAIDEAIRTEFFSKIEDAINNHGGTITIYDTIDLQLARKP